MFLGVAMITNAVVTWLTINGIRTVYISLLVLTVDDHVA